MLYEHAKILELSSFFSKPAFQYNSIYTSDAELLKLEDEYYLAITTDSIVEEISTGLYNDPYQMGWMVVVANLSDLAAVGADPLGLLIIQNFPANFSKAETKEFVKGVRDACTKHKTYILGGDSNTSNEIQLAATAVGEIRAKTIISRLGIQAQDILFSTGKLGAGGAYAYSHFMTPDKSDYFLPIARLTEGKLIRQYGTSCIDSSDGFFPAISTLISLNNCSIQLSLDLAELVDRNSFEIAIKNKVPPWVFLAGPHGEFELIFTISKTSLLQFKNECNNIGWAPVEIGRIIEEKHLNKVFDIERRTIDPFVISNLFEDSAHDPLIYLKELLKIEKTWK